MKKTRNIVVALALLVTAACSSPPPAAPPGATQEDEIRRFGAILDYVAADYAAAVVDGKIVDQGEYDEQIVFLKDAVALSAKLPPGKTDVAAALAKLQKQVADKAPPPDIARDARALRSQVLDEHGVVLAPTVPPSRERGAELFQQMCTSCHGATGAGDGQAAVGMVPPPRSFHDAEVMADLSPTRAYNAMTDGIRGTAMPSFGAFSQSDRWALAFYVFGLQHGPEAVRRGEAAYQKSNRPVAATSTRLAAASDRDIVDLGARAGLSAAEAKDLLAFLRADAPFRAGDAGAPLERARKLLAAATTAYRAGDAGSARQHIGAAYLDGFEPQEGALRGRDEGLVLRIEERFLAMRQQIAGGAPVVQVEREALQLGALLDRAEEVLGGGDGARLAFVSTLLVILREGVEAALLIMLLLGMARRAGAGDGRAVHAGWIAAAVIGLVTWFASGPIVRMDGASRELMEGIVALLAAVVLLATGHFVIARADARARVDSMKRRLAAATSGGRRAWVLAGLAFAAVYREAFEVVLFLRAIALGSPGAGQAVLAGVAAGAVLLVGFVYLLGKLGKRLKPGPLLATMGTLLCVLSVVLAGKGIRALQEAGVVGIHPLPLPRLDWLGFFPTAEGVVAQLVVFGVFVAIAATAWLRSRRDPVPTADAEPAR